MNEANGSDWTAVLYHSLASAPPDAAMLFDILRASERNNTREGLSGNLAVCAGHFLQYIEGNGGALAARVAIIRADPRHRIDWLMDIPTQRPRLRGLPMGLIDMRLEPMLARALPGLAIGRWRRAEARGLVDALVQVARHRHSKTLRRNA